MQYDAAYDSTQLCQAGADDRNQADIKRLPHRDWIFLCRQNSAYRPTNNPCRFRCSSPKADFRKRPEDFRSSTAGACNLGHPCLDTGVNREVKTKNAPVSATQGMAVWTSLDTSETRTHCGIQLRRRCCLQHQVAEVVLLQISKASSAVVAQGSMGVL